MTAPQRVRLHLDEDGHFTATAAPLGASLAQWRYAISPERVTSGDPLLRHKTDWRELYEHEFARLFAETGCDEVLFLNERGEVTEGSRSNVFIRRDGTFVTPPLSAGVLDGCLRREMIEKRECVEETLMPDDLVGDVFLGNSLRGLIPARNVT